MPQREDKQSEFSEIELLVISPLQDTGQIVQKQMRDAGHNVHVSWLEKPENLGDELQRQIPQLILCDSAGDDQDLNRLVGLCLNIARGVPVIAMVPELTADRSAGLLQNGAAEVVSAAHPVLMTRALERELEFVELRGSIKKSRREISGLKKQLSAIVAESPEALAYVHEGIHTNLNSSYAKLFGFDDPEELEGVPFMDLVAPQSRDNVKAVLSTAAKGKSKPETVAFVAQRADDSNVSLNLRCRAANLGGEAQIELLITHNTPTVVAPAAPSAFEGRMSLYRALLDIKALRLKERSIGLLSICIDDLEKLQDRIGLIACDQILNEVSLFLLDSCTNEDQCFRLNISEFVLLAAADSPEDITATAKKLRAAIDAQVFGDEKVSSPLTASIAVAHLGEDEANATHLLKTMRLAQAASRKDGNTVVVLSSDDRNKTDRESDRIWLDKIKKSLEGDRFRLAYQTIASLDGDGAQLLDVLLRMLGDTGEAIRAGEFLPTAERNGLMAVIDQWVVQQVLSVNTQKRTKTDSPVMFVKLTKATIENSETFLPWLEKLISELDVNVEKLAFAFDEEALQYNTNRATKLIQALKQLNLQIAIHSFGDSANSLQLLDLIDADYIKLAPLFTEALVSPEQDQRFTDTIHAAQEKSIKIIASHVEDANSMARLWQSGVNYIQGYFVHEPDSTAETQPGLNVA